MLSQDFLAEGVWQTISTPLGRVLIYVNHIPLSSKLMVPG